MEIRVKITDDIDKETGKQKYRPAIVIKSYPSHVKVQLMTTEPSNLAIMITLKLELIIKFNT